jgi:NDP-sugar pyrophosphorylase family protein
VLTAGLGTRLRPLTDVRAKPAIPVAGIPMVRRIIAWLASHGVTDCVLNLHYRPETIAALVGDGGDLGVRVRYSWEQPKVLGSAGGPRLALPILGAETLLIVNGDTLTDLDLGALVRAHEESGALVTLALVPNREFTRYGGVVLDDAGAVTGFVPRGPSANGTGHYVGVQVAHASVFDEVRPGDAVNSIGGIYDRLIAARPGAVRGFMCDAPFWDVGTVTDYWNTSQAFASNDAAAPAAAHAPRIDASARVTRSIMWDDVTVDAGAVLDECIVADGVHIPRGASYRHAAIVAGADGEPLASPFETEIR